MKRVLPVLLLTVSLAGCAIKPHKVFAPPPPVTSQIFYSLADFKADAAEYNKRVSSNDLAGAKIIRDKAAKELKIAIDYNFEAWSQGLAEVRSNAGLASDIVTSGVAAGSNIATRTLLKNIFSASGLAVAGITKSVQYRYYSNEQIEQLKLFMQKARAPYIQQFTECLAKDVSQCSLTDAREKLNGLFWAGTLESARVQMTIDAAAPKP